jgi:hypothetical protein
MRQNGSSDAIHDVKLSHKGDFEIKKIVIHLQPK